MKARRARAIRRASQRRSQNRDGLGLSELFLAPARDAATILRVRDLRLKCYLLGFTQIPTQRRTNRRAAG
ncbi:MAG: hypothetical protein ACE5E6_00605 [Phycisphaerae bacterium]